MPQLPKQMEDFSGNLGYTEIFVSDLHWFSGAMYIAQAYILNIRTLCHFQANLAAQKIAHFSHP